MSKEKKIAIGIDIGGSGIKGAPVSMKSGKFKDDRLRIPTPPNAEPEEIADIVATIVRSFNLPDAPVGITFPAPVKDGVIPVVSNLSQSWAGVHAQELFSHTLGHPVAVLNDADAAGLAEEHFGAAKGKGGTVLMLTLGTGIGSALVFNGELVPNTELGHLHLPELPEGVADAEKWAASSVFERDELSMEEWARRLQIYFNEIEFLLSPRVIIIGGGISKKHDQFLPLISTQAQLVPAKLRNKAGIVGAALMAYQHAPRP